MSNIVLIINESQTLYQLISAHMRSSGFVLHPTNGRVGVAAAASLKPGVILLDIDHAQSGGVKVYQSLKANTDTAEIPVICLTTATSCNQLFKGVMPGALDVIYMPINPDELKAKVSAVLQIQCQLRV